MVPKTIDRSTQKLRLPLQVTSPADVSRLLREITRLEESWLQLQVRQSGRTVNVPKASLLLQATAELNNYNLLQPNDRQLLQRFRAVAVDTGQFQSLALPHSLDEQLL